jgi:hypothetical protein
MDRWNENEVRFIAKNGNHNINKVYERYLPTSLDKPTPASSMEVRKEWIKAKYINKDFMTPFTLNEKMRDLSNRSRAVNLPKVCSHAIFSRYEDPFPIPCLPQLTAITKL